MPVKHILLNAKVPVNATCLRPVVDLLRRDASVTLWLTSRYRGTRLRPGKLLRDLPPSHRVFQSIPVVHPVPAPVARFMKFDLYLSPDMAMPGSRKCAHRVHMFHGISPKGASISPKALNYNELFLFGEYQRRRFVEKGIVEEGDGRLKMIGFPKLDCLVDGSLDTKEIRAGLEIPKDRKVILYAPTWRGTSLTDHGDEIVEALAGLDAHVIVKLHDHSLDRRLAGRAWDERLAAWEAGENVTVHRDPDVCPAMAIADLLVSDHSSVANEFLLVDRPVIYFETEDLRKHYSDKQIDQRMIETRPGHTVTEAGALAEAVTHALENPDEHGPQRRAWAAELFHRPGTASHRAVERIYQILDIEPFLATEFAIRAAHRRAEEEETARNAAAAERGEDLTVTPFADRGRYPGQASMA